MRRDEDRERIMDGDRDPEDENSECSSQSPSHKTADN